MTCIKRVFEIIVSYLFLFQLLGSHKLSDTYSSKETMPSVANGVACVFLTVVKQLKGKRTSVESLFIIM